MAITFFFTFILTLAKAGIWVLLGLLIYKHYEFLWSLITHKLKDEIPSDKKESICKIIKWIGVCVIVIGIATITTGLFTISFGMSHF